MIGEHLHRATHQIGSYLRNAEHDGQQLSFCHRVVSLSGAESTGKILHWVDQAFGIALTEDGRNADVAGVGLQDEGGFRREVEEGKSSLCSIGQRLFDPIRAQTNDSN